MGNCANAPVASVSNAAAALAHAMRCLIGDLFIDTYSSDYCRGCITKIAIDLQSLIYTPPSVWRRCSHASH